MDHYIPYFQTTRYRVQAIIDLLTITKGQRAADLGSGDGRVVVALALAGADAFGYELDTTLIQKSIEDIKKKRLENTAHILQRDFWAEDLSKYSINFAYPMPDIMAKLEEKLQKELLPGSKVLLNYYPFPNWKETMHKNHIYFYAK